MSLEVEADVITDLWEEGQSRSASGEGSDPKNTA